MNNLLIIDLNKSNIADLKQKLSEKFKMSNLDPVSHYLGLEIQRDRTNKIIRLNQKIYLKKILANLNMIELRKASNSMNSSLVLELASNDFIVEDFDKVRYQFVVNSLMYLMLRTRSNIAFAISQVSRFATNSTQVH